MHKSIHDFATLMIRDRWIVQIFNTLITWQKLAPNRKFLTFRGLKIPQFINVEFWKNAPIDNSRDDAAT